MKQNLVQIDKQKDITKYESNLFFAFLQAILFIYF